MLIAATIAPEAYVGLVIALGLGVLGWRAARRFRAQHGTTQWGAPAWLWGLLFLCFWISALVVLGIAKAATLRDISGTYARSGAQHPKRARIAAAAVLFVLGPAAVVGGAIGVAVSQHTDLVSLTMASPGRTMVATAVGSGGSQPTALLPGAGRGTGIFGSTVIPTTPIIYLVPATPTAYGVPTGTESAYWKVWWDGGAQLQDVVSLEQHLDAADAADEITNLENQAADPSKFSGDGLTFTSVDTFSIPGVPASSGYTWTGTTSDGRTLQFRFALFSRGDVAALVSTTAFQGSIDPSHFDAFALAEYGRMAAAASSLPSHTFFDVLVAIGASLVVTAVIAVFGATYRPRPEEVPSGPFHAAYSVAPYPPPPAPPPPLPDATSDEQDSSPPIAAGAAGEPSTPLRAGWFPDPADTASGVLRYWDGFRWTAATTKPPPSA